MKQSTRTRRAIWKDAFLGPGVGAAGGTIVGYTFDAPAVGAAIGAGAGVLWLRNRGSARRTDRNQHRKGSS